MDNSKKQKKKYNIWVSNFNVFGMYALLFYIGALFVYYDGLTMANMFKSIFGIVFAAMVRG